MYYVQEMQVVQDDGIGRGGRWVRGAGF